MAYIIQNHWKKKNLLWALQFQFNSNLTVEHILLYNYWLSNCLWTPNAYRLVVRKVFLFQMLGETSIFTLPSKVPLWEKVKMVFCVAIWIWMSPLTYWNLNSSKLFVLQRLFGFMLVFCGQKVKWYTFPKRFV